MTLETEVRDLLDGRPGTWGVYARHLVTDETVAINADVVMPAQSSLKTGVLVVYERAAEQGTALVAAGLVVASRQPAPQMLDPCSTASGFTIFTRTPSAPPSSASDRAGEFLPQYRILGRHADRAGIEMTLAHHDAAERNQRRGGKTEFIRTQQRANGDIAPGAQSAIHLHGNPTTQPVQHQSLLRFGKADLPRRSGMRQRGQGRGAGAALISCNCDVIGAGLGNACRDRADAHFGDQFHRNTRACVGIFKIVDELCQILDGIDVVMRRR